MKINHTMSTHFSVSTLFSISYTYRTLDLQPKGGDDVLLLLKIKPPRKFKCLRREYIKSVRYDNIIEKLHTKVHVLSLSNS